jgi:hypothetical protein
MPDKLPWSFGGPTRLAYGDRDLTKSPARSRSPSPALTTPERSTSPELPPRPSSRIKPSMQASQVANIIASGAPPYSPPNPERKRPSEMNKSWWESAANRVQSKDPESQWWTKGSFLRMDDAVRGTRATREELERVQHETLAAVDRAFMPGDDGRLKARVLLVQLGRQCSRLAAATERLETEAGDAQLVHERAVKQVQNELVESRDSGDKSTARLRSEVENSEARWHSSPP